MKICLSNMLNLIKTPFTSKEKNKVHPLLCDQVKQFGFCEKPCTKRHVLSKTLDKDTLNIPSKCFISIQLTKIVSASHFYGRILKYSTSKDPKKDQDWTTYNDSFERIKDDLKYIGSSLDAKIVCKNLVVGEMVMVETEQKEFFRAITLDIVHGWFSVKVKVQLIDLGRIEEFNSNKVFELPSHLKEFRPVAVEIIISSMEPFEEGSDTILNWPASTTKCVRSLLEPMILINLEFVCKVELVLGTTLWIDWLLVKKCIKCTHFACKLYKNALMLPRELIDRNLAKGSSKLIDKLINLDKDIHIWGRNFNDEKSKNKLYKKPNVQLFSCDEKKINIDKEIQPQWAHLSNTVLYHVFVVFVEDPTCFLVNNLEFVDRTNVLQKDIDEAINNNVVEQLTSPSVGTVCLALSPRDNNYNRVIIKKIDDSEAVILFVDHGGLYQVNINSLMTIPASLITKLPFQIIECKLSGYKEILEVDIGNKFANNLIQLTNSPISLKVLSSISETKLTGGNSYEVVLFNNDININTAMANDYNVYVDNTQIQNIISSNYNHDELKCDGVDEDEFYEEDLQCQIDLLKSLLNIPENNSKNPNDKSISTNLSEDKIENKSITVSNKPTEPESINLSQDKRENKSIEINNKQIDPVSIKLSQGFVTNNNNNKQIKKFCLVCNVTPVVPQCLWHQDKQWIYLKLNVLSVNNYNIHHTMDSLSIKVETNSASYHFIAIFFASITKESFTSHVTYDGIQIKAQKLIQVNYRWPRLLKCSKKHRYIIYNTEHVAVRKDMNLFANMVNKYKMKAVGTSIKMVSYDSDFDDSEDDDSENYTVFED